MEPKRVMIHTGGPALILHPGETGPRKLRNGEKARSLEDGTIVNQIDMVQKKYRGFSRWLKIQKESETGWVAAVYTLPLD